MLGDVYKRQAFDGTGYGTDGAIWGGEVLLADYHGFRRLAHLAYCLLYTSDAADDPLCLDLGGCRFNNKKTTTSPLNTATCPPLTHRHDHT